jgi:2-polyprenyl-3-methyl-5-hydroxy-6-metoxy-1,4-benzoquinol methylase
MSDFDPIAYVNMVKTHQESGDVLGWFDSIYTDARGDYKSVFWADLAPSPYLLKWIKENETNPKKKKAIVVGCGVGDDTEALSAFGYEVTVFDVSPEAIKLCKGRYPKTKSKVYS